MIKTEKNVYEPREASDGRRILVMRLWPRGVARSHVDEWLKDLGSSRKLIEDWKRERIGWAEAKRRYQEEMKDPEKQKLIRALAERGRKETLTLLCGCRDPNRCHRAILKELIDRS